MDRCLIMSGVPDKATPLPRLRPELILIEGAPTAMGEPAWLIQDPLQHRYFQIDKPTYHIFFGMVRVPHG